MSDSHSSPRVTRDVFFYVVEDNYDEHAELAIPHYREMHRDLEELLKQKWERKEPLKALDLGAGTGKTTEIILQNFPHGKVVFIEKFPEMIRHAKIRLSDYETRVQYMPGDFMEIGYGTGFNVCVSALAIHHQDEGGKRQVFKKVFDALAPGGHFYMIDWTKFSDPFIHEVAFRIAEEHVREALNRNPNIMKEWIDHWRNLNIPDTVEDQCLWLREAGFNYADCVTRYYGMALIYASKGNGS